MSITTRLHTILTSHGAIAVEESGKDSGIPLLLIHGNSFSHDVFRYQLQGSLAENYRLIAFDLPGQGKSENAPEPMRTYTLPGFADAVIELLEKMGITETVILGWSLGGHIAIEMLSRFSGIQGLMITGTPPVGRNSMSQGFSGSPHTGMAGKEIITEAEIAAFVTAIFGRSAEPFLLDIVRRADGRFRKRLFEAAREGAGADQRRTVENSMVPLAVVNGAADSIINLNYFDTVDYANLWEDQCYQLPGLGHAPFWEGPDQFNPLLERFLQYTGAGR
ncbi:alpha/beta fold hydrolase [Chitinophaga sp. CF418]|uniref:alpha/beta fold hydrolase n=1 Tax=Chitinophaga sp. CF418 TaxID=1855287 RepID=UPI00091E9CA2|nr:alpha/beta hydrolase [Chitinophaga sp. CF418]SHN10424.1 Pimeloyl-ACP methyl ester carboxylesterase [Chitinophaga sp. CF418]